jgi:hypothetical protein
VAHTVEHLPSKHEALSSKPSTTLPLQKRNQYIFIYHLSIYLSIYHLSIYPSIDPDILFILLFLNSLIFWWQWCCTQDLAFAKQVLYHLSHSPSPFCFSYFSSMPRLCLDCSPPISASYLAEMTTLCHSVKLLLVEMESQELFGMAGLQLRASQSLPPEWLGLQI